MKTRQIIYYTLLTALSSVSLLPAAFADRSPEAESRAADNSGRNVVDRDSNTVLPENQSNEPDLVERTAAIRREITSVEGLSLSARNIKIVTLASGTVILRGPVSSEKEKQIVEGIADRVGGDAPVKSYIEIAKG